MFLLNCLLFVHFDSEFKFNGSMMKSGDDVIINGDKDEFFVGHIEKLYELEGNDDPNRAIIQWYFTYQELMKLKKKITVDIAEPWRELFLPCDEDVRCSSADIDAETISRKCTVLKLRHQDLPPDNLDCDKQQDLFYVRYKFDRHYNLHPVNKRIARESLSKREHDLVMSVNNATCKTPNGMPRRLSAQKQKPANENGNKTGKTPQARKTPARRKSECIK